MAEIIEVGCYDEDYNLVATVEGDVRGGEIVIQLPLPEGTVWVGPLNA